jgi:HAD superfamily hydrolase (TIGR01484 family)
MKPYKNQGPIRLVVADVDGTLVTQEKVLTAKTKEAVSQLTAAGIAFAITSGRPPRGMQTVIKDVNLSNRGRRLQRRGLHDCQAGSDCDA